MFPFKDETSDDEAEEVRLRRRLVVSAATITVSGTRSSANEETSTDDRGETSGEDRTESSTEDRKTGTSESDVAASPNPRGNSSSKNKKKKKKKTITFSIFWTLEVPCLTDSFDNVQTCTVLLEIRIFSNK